MVKDIWHYPRTELADQVVNMFEVGLSSALIFFAPRRMGKTEFLLKDIQPIAMERGFLTFYFSFLDVKKNAQEEFSAALSKYAENSGIKNKTLKFLKKIKSIHGEAAGVKAGLELSNAEGIKSGMKKTLEGFAKKGKLLLLLDEVQVLIKEEHNGTFVAGLRTVLDTHKDNIKVIFTGSSREGLRQMFSQASAPFFHFGQNLPFPNLEKPFTDHLAHLFHKVTKRRISKVKLWSIFLELEQVPQLIRSLVERCALYPNVSIEEVKVQLLDDIFNDRAFPESWNSSTALERLLLMHVASDGDAIFSRDTQKLLAKKLGVGKLSVPAIQSAIRSLQKKSLIGRNSDRGGYFVEDPNFKSWLLQR